MIDVYGERADFGEDEKMEKTMMAFINPAPPPRIVVQGRRKRAFLIHEQAGMQKRSDNIIFLQSGLGLRLLLLSEEL